MKNHLRNFLGCVGVAAATCLVGPMAAAVVQAQPPRGDRDGQSAGSVDAAVNRLMSYDADKDGKLSKTEVTDGRLLPLWQRCDANNDGVVTRDELTAQLGKEAGPQNRAGNSGPANPGPGNGPGPGGLGGSPSGRGPGGPPPGPGQILPPFVQDELKLTETQRTQLQELQKEVDARLGKILTPEQLQQLQQPRGRGPGGGGQGPGGRPRQ